ncbi:MAG: lysophospholipid acyltransferase family protein [Epsilonproteobacteria bacterium]|nr:lysophospholipid acyltransferase family protein [Campylobacterota bacterium]
MIDVQRAITQKYPTFQKLPTQLTKPMFGAVKRLIHENDINSFLEKNQNLGPYEFIEKVLDYFSFSYKSSNKDLENIPVSGRVVIIANHPLGALDALSLIHMIKGIRSDIKVVANDMLGQIEQLKPILISVDAFNSKIAKESIQQVYSALDNEEAVIIFPSGEVSRARPTGIKDIKWQKGFLNFAIKKNAPILPIYIRAKNSALFYTISSINKKLSAALLPHEMFSKDNKSLEFKVGELIPYKSFASNSVDKNTQIKLFKKHLYRVAKNRKPIFLTQKCIAHPEDRQKIKEELKSALLLGETTDHKKIYLFEYSKESSVMREIARLRELTFRKVEEGTGEKRDSDHYDTYYKHIVLWDEEKLEIVGSYRIGESNYIKKYYDKEGFYSHSLFNFQEGFEEYLENSIELGRSFVQPKYWGSRALDYLWQGIGAYLHKNPHIRYMFGPVSLSSSFAKGAQNLIIYYYKHYHGTKTKIVKPQREFIIDKSEEAELNALFCKNDAKKDFSMLKTQLHCYGVSVPTLYKQYTDLCEEDGIQFLDFNIDKDFNDCVDSFILVDIDKIKAKKRDRYIK